MDYDDWSKALSKYWLAISRDGEAVLALEPLILVDVAKQIGVEFECADDAVASFIAAVRKYQLLGRPWRVETATGKRAPRFLILIAIQVFAASQMDDIEGECTKAAYYMPLKKLVGDDSVTANFAAEYGQDHLALWRSLRNWLEKNGRKIHLPSERKNGRYDYVGLPKSQALLRRADLAQLPIYFRSCGYRPGADLSEDRVTRDVEIRRSNAECFPSNWARRVLEDEHRFPTAVRQIFNELQKWDGEWELATPGSNIRDNFGRNKCWFGISGKRSLLVSKIGRSLETSTTISVDDLQSLMSGKKAVNGSRLHLVDGIYVGRFDTDDCMYQQVSTFEPGDRGLLASDRRNFKASKLLERLLECSDVATNAQFYGHEDATDGEIIPLRGVPKDSIFTSFEVADPLPYRDWVDPIWHRFLKSPRPMLVPTGGLRFGRKKNWVEGVGPNIRIVGTRLPVSITIDDQEVKVVARVVTHIKLSDPGEHVVRAIIDRTACECRVLVSRPLEPTVVVESERRWRFAAREIPSWVTIDESENSLIGMHYLIAKSESTTQTEMSQTDERLAAIRALVKFPVTFGHDSALFMQHPLAKWLVGNNR